MDKVFIIKIGGNIIDDEKRLDDFLEEFSFIGMNKILVHGGGKLATELAEKLGVTQKMIEGRRITDKETLRIITMVYAGLINKTIVAKLQSFDVNAIGLTGADANMILSKKRQHPGIDYGFVGDVQLVDISMLNKFLQAALVPVFAPVTHDHAGQLLNTNADTIAKEIATSLGDAYETVLIYLFEKKGVLLDEQDDDSVIPMLSLDKYNSLRSENRIFAGMIPKLDNAFNAINNGVSTVVIGKAEELDRIIAGTAGTRITNG